MTQGARISGRTPLPAAQTELTLRGLTTAWRSLLVEQRTELTQVFATDGNVKWSPSCAEGEEVSVNSMLVSAGAKGLQPAEELESRQPRAQGRVLTDSTDTVTGHDS